MTAPGQQSGSKYPANFWLSRICVFETRAIRQALADYDAALTLTKNPDNADRLYGRGMTKLKKGDPAAAMPT